MHIAGNGKYNSFNKTKVNNKWVMLVILIIFDVNKSLDTILSDLCIVAVVKYLHNLIKYFELSVDISCVRIMGFLMIKSFPDATFYFFCHWSVRHWSFSLCDNIMTIYFVI